MIVKCRTNEIFIYAANVMKRDCNIVARDMISCIFN